MACREQLCHDIKLSQDWKREHPCVRTLVDHPPSFTAAAALVNTHVMITAQTRGIDSYPCAL